MKRICEFCGKEYEVDISLGNWRKGNIQKLGHAGYSCKRFCSYECGKQHMLEKSKITNLEKYGVSNVSKNKNIQNKISKGNKISWQNKENRLNKIKENNRKIYGVEFYNNRDKAKKTCLERYGVEYIWQVKEVKEKIKKTNLTKKGVEYSLQDKNIRNQIKQTNLIKYGVDCGLKSKEIRNKINNTCQKKYNSKEYLSSKDFKNKSKISIKNKYNVLYYSQTNEWKFKVYNTKKKNNSFNTSKPEEDIYQLLLQKFKEVKRQYKSELYPFMCDFYIPSLDLYIEYQGYWTHGNEPYNENNEEHRKQIELWKNQTKKQYKQAINVWTIRDPLKRQTAKENGLNWIEFFNVEEFMRWYNI